MASQTQAPISLRAVAAALALAGGGAFLYDLFANGVSSWLDGLIVAGASYGLFLFSFFAIKGRLPGSLLAQSTNAGGTRGASDA